jgi:hypothetical protein
MPRSSPATDLTIYVADPHPRGNAAPTRTNGLLRQYFPTGTNLSAHTVDHLVTVAAELNNGPRKTLNWLSPKEKLNQPLSPKTTLQPPHEFTPPIEWTVQSGSLSTAARGRAVSSV